MSTTSTVTVDPALIGSNTFTLQANLDSAQDSVALRLAFPASGGNPGPVMMKNLSHSPYTMFWATGDPFRAISFGPGTHSFRVTPDGGVARSYPFVVVGGVPRRIGGYRDDFQPGSPDARWLYCWNDAGAVQTLLSRRTLNWHPGQQHYSETGANWPNGAPSELWQGALSATGGWPGLGTTHGVAQDRCVMAGYRIALNGFVQIQDLEVTPKNSNTTGIDVWFIVETTGGAVASQTLLGTVLFPAPWDGVNTAKIQVSAGDIAWIALGPHSNSAYDKFDLDYEVWFNESIW